MKKFKLTLNKKIVSRLADIKGGTDVTKTCPIIVHSLQQTTEPTRLAGAACETQYCYTEVQYCTQAAGCNTLQQTCTSMKDCNTYYC